MKKVLFLLLSAINIHTFAQPINLGKGVSYSVETSATLSSGKHAPFWLTANKYGLTSTERNSGYLRGEVFRTITNDPQCKWDIGYGADLVVATNHSSDFFVQQLYAEVRWLKGTLTVGQRQQAMQLKNNELSSGSQTLGINARPYPELRFALPTYWTIPGTKQWVALKGHMAWGIYTDSRFQENIVRGTGNYTHNTLAHSKAGYLRIGKPQHAFSVEGGLEMAAQFGGTSYVRTAHGYETYHGDHGLKTLWNTFFFGGSDPTDGNTQNNEGNILGSWLLRLNYDAKDATFGLYADHFFEDHSAMFHLDYDGYAYENGTMVRKDKRYLLYPLKDIMLGADVHLKRCKWVSDATLEYVYTRYQSGPVYADRTPQFPDHIGGVDNYYNHSTMPGWQHWGQTMGNPLYISPIYNEERTLTFQCNRFTAWHMGIAGQPTEQLHYRLRATWQEGLGTYEQPFFNPKHNVSVGIETDYKADCLYKGLHIGAAFGFDRGQLLGNNTGGMLTLKVER